MLVAAAGREPDARRHAGRGRGRDAVVEDAERAPRTRSVPLSAPVIANAWHSRAGPGEQVAVAPGLHPPRAHDLDAVDRRRGAQQHRGGVAPVRWAPTTLAHQCMP